MNATDAASSLFDRLPTVAQVNVLRFFSKAPEQEDWASNISSASMLEVAEDGHPLQQLAKSVLTDVTIMQLDEDWIERTRGLLDAFGATCTSLSMKGVDSTDIEPLLTTHSVPNLKRLSLHKRPLRLEPLGRFLEKQKKLEEVQIRWADWSVGMPQALSQRGPGLKRLVLSTSLTFKDELSRMFETIGSTLEFLKIFFRKDDQLLNASKFDVTSLPTSCPRVTELSIRWSITHLREEEVSLYALYGAQLQRVHLFGMDFSDAFVNTLALCCPNAFVDLSGVHGDPTPLMKALGASVSAVKLFEDVAPTNRIMRAATVAESVESLGIGSRNAFAFFERPKSKLRRLILTIDEDAENFDEAVVTIAKNSGDLRQLKVTCEGISAHALEELSIRNPLLESVEMYYMVPKGVEKRDEFRQRSMVNLLRAFVRCKSLKVLHLSVIPMFLYIPDARVDVIDDACVPYRCRNVSIHLDLLEYNFRRSC